MGDDLERYLRERGLRNPDPSRSALDTLIRTARQPNVSSRSRFWVDGKPMPWERFLRGGAGRS